MANGDEWSNYQTIKHHQSMQKRCCIEPIRLGVFLNHFFFIVCNAIGIVFYIWNWHVVFARERTTFYILCTFFFHVRQIVCAD